MSRGKIALAAAAAAHAAVIGILVLRGSGRAPLPSPGKSGIPDQKSRTSAAAIARLAARPQAEPAFENLQILRETLRGRPRDFLRESAPLFEKILGSPYEAEARAMRDEAARVVLQDLSAAVRADLQAGRFAQARERLAGFEPPAGMEEEAARLRRETQAAIENAGE